MMKYTNWLPGAGLVLLVAFITSCATTHPNEKMIVGRWKPQKVEIWIPPDQAEQMKASQEAQKGQPAAQKPQGKAADQKKGQGATQKNSIDRLMGLEQRTLLSIESNHTLAKSYPGKIVKGTWKMKGNGTLLLAKNIETKEKYKIDIAEISPTHIVTIQHHGDGGLKITYVKEE